MSENIPHSLAGFRGAFESEYGRKPTEQEIWNAAIRSWRDLTQQKSDATKERAEVIEHLLMYAGDNGYSHIDYADTMRHAAAILSVPALPATKCVCGENTLGVVHRADGPCYWPTEPHIAIAAMPVGDLTEAQILDKNRIEQCVAVLVNVATFGSNSKYEYGAPTPNRLLQLDCAKYLHGLVSAEDFESANKFFLGQFESVPAAASSQPVREPLTWMPIESAPEGLLVAVGWIDKEDGTAHYDFDYLEDGVWQRYFDYYEHLVIAGAPGRAEDAPYTYWMDIAPLPAAHGITK